VASAYVERKVKDGWRQAQGEEGDNCEMKYVRAPIRKERATEKKNPSTLSTSTPVEKEDREGKVKN